MLVSLCVRESNPVGGWCQQGAYRILAAPGHIVFYFGFGWIPGGFTGYGAVSRWKSFFTSQNCNSDPEAKSRRVEVLREGEILTACRTVLVGFSAVRMNETTRPQPKNDI